MASKMKKVDIKAAILTAIGYLLPLVVASGLLIAIGNLAGGQNLTIDGENIKTVSDLLAVMTVPSALTTMGVLGMGLLPAFISGYTAFAIADRPGIAPGFIMGMVANVLGAGFLGGLVGGILAGYIALISETYIKPPKWAQALMPMMVVPTLTAICAGLLMIFLLGGPISALAAALTSFIKGLDQSQRLAYGFILGFIQHLDYGGAISKVPNLICDGMMADSIYGPEAVKVLGSMVPPFGVALALVLSRVIKKPIFYKEEEENIKVAFPMGICMITEGVIPIAMNDLVRTVIATALGDATCGAIAFSMGVESRVPSGGMFVVPAMTNPGWALVALAAGSAVTAVLLLLLKRSVDPEKEKQTEEEEVDLSGLSFS